MLIAIDLDGTLAEEKRTFERALAKPLPGAVEGVKRLKAAGHRIIVYTARGWAEYEVTENWLKAHDFPYDQIIMGKPIVDAFLDDRALTFVNWEHAEEVLLTGHRVESESAFKGRLYAWRAQELQFLKWLQSRPGALAVALPASYGLATDAPKIEIGFPIAQSELNAALASSLQKSKAVNLALLGVLERSERPAETLAALRSELPSGAEVSTITTWLPELHGNPAAFWGFTQEGLTRLFDGADGWRVEHMRLHYDSRHGVRPNGIECIARKI